MSLHKNEIQEVLSAFPELKIIVVENGTKFTGSIKVNNIYNDVHIIDKYDVEIFVPNDYPSELPIVKETGNKIKGSYPHINSDGILCLATTAEIRIDFGNEFNIVGWINKYVIPYFFSYGYYTKYGIFPFGERSHAVLGSIEFYKEYFQLNTRSQCKSVLEYICSKDRYRGHDSCPCGSGKRIRSCHGESIIKCKEEHIKSILLSDLKFM